MTKAVIFMVLGCFLVVGTAAASILMRDSVPVVRSEDLPAAATASALGIFSNKDVSNKEVSNKEAKEDRLMVAALARIKPQQTVPAAKEALPSSSESLRQAFASDGTVDVAVPNITAPATIPSPKPKLAAKPPTQKSYTLLSDAQIAAIKGRLNLSSGQEAYWPAVEAALRRIAAKIHEQRQAKPNAGGPPIDPDSEEVQQLKSAAMPLLFQLREDQKREVRSLARIIGLEAVASAI